MPVRAERHPVHRAGVAGQRGADRLAGAGVPQPHRPVGAGRGQALAVGAERHPVHRAGVAGDDLQGAGPLDHRGVNGALGAGSSVSERAARTRCKALASPPDSVPAKMLCASAISFCAVAVRRLACACLLEARGVELVA